VFSCAFAFQIAIVLGKHHALQTPQNGSLPPNIEDILRLDSPLPSFLAPAPPLPGLPKISNGKNYTQRCVAKHLSPENRRIICLKGRGYSPVGENTWRLERT